MGSEAINEALASFPTPFYLFDEGEMHKRAVRLRSLFPSRAKLCYSMKANPFVLEQANRDAERIEVCSTGELRICQALNIPFNKIVVSGVHKDDGLIHELVSGLADVCRYTVESVAQYELLVREAREADVCIPILPRLTSGNQFGMDPKDIESVMIQAQAESHVHFCGIEYFSGTQKTSSKRLKRELEHLDRFIKDMDERLGLKIPELEFGPGLPAEYFEADEELVRSQEDDLISALAEALESMDFDGDLFLELGRGLAASCGTYATRIVDAKCNDGVNYAIVDGGKHQLVYYGNALAMKQPVCHIYPLRDTSDTEPWNICGSLCTASDILAKQLDLADVKVGDVMVFERAGAYSMTEGIALFLSRDLPRVVMCDNDGNLRLARDRIETYPINTPGAAS